MCIPFFNLFGLKWIETTARQEVGKNASGTIFEQQVQLDSGIYVRRITIRPLAELIS
ncbi:MAG: hypothetical protein LH649_11725 [Pseudanabaena sp. CAN_BIN31]|nr:hypothetical protein [Pseudanabaena sp. CAN_BIN31]